jgi:hypothetical protein
MIRKLFVVGALTALPLGFLVRANSAWGGAPPIDNSNDTITCNTVIGSAKIKPALTFTGGAGATAIQIKGTLDGCTDGTNSAVKIGPSKFKGILTGSSTNCLSLSGTSSVTGSLDIKWKNASLTCFGGTNDGTACATSATCTGGGTCSSTAITQKDSTVTLTTLNGGMYAPGMGIPGTYGDFGIGSGTATVAGGFTGGNGGATSTALLVTGQDIVAEANACAGPGLKAITLGIGTLTLQ